MATPQDSSTADLARFQATMQAIELACGSIQIDWGSGSQNHSSLMYINPAAAEATLLSLSQSPRPYQACQFILENSQMANARFQAAGAIRDAAIREWAFLEAPDRRGLISFCLSFIMKNANSHEGYVLVKVASVAAQLLKRGWLDFTAAEKEAFFVEVKEAAIGNRGLDMQFIGINFLESLVSEFSPSTSTAMGLPREFHEQCRISLEHDYMKAFYCWVQYAAFNASDRIVGADSEIPEVKVCSAALRFMLQILNWDFRAKNAVDNSKRGIDVFSDGMKQENNSLRRSECVLVQPGPAWRDVLVSSGHVGWLLNFYTTLRQKFSFEGYWLDCPLAVSARKLIVQFCSLAGPVFPSDGGHMQRQHLLQLLAVIVQWLEPPDAVAKAINAGKSESEMLDGCRALMSVATVTTPFVFDELLKNLRPYGLLTLLSALMCEVFKDLMENRTEEETWSWVARDILLDTWTSLLVVYAADIHVPLVRFNAKDVWLLWQQLDGNGPDNLLPPEAISAAGNLFSQIVDSELKASSASAFSDEDECDALQASVSAMDERLSSYALIARAAIGHAIPLLTERFSELVIRVNQVSQEASSNSMIGIANARPVGRSIRDPTETLEELYSLLLIAGHVLADEGQGETPLVPKQIESYYTDIMEVDKHPVGILCGSIIRFAEQSLDPEMRNLVFSPRLMEAVVWFLARWSSTYLMPLERSGENGSGLENRKHSANSLLSFFGEENQGKVVLDIIIRISLSTLLSYPGEKDLQGLTCYQLLHGLVKRKAVISHLITLDSWHDLANAFANQSVLFSLSADHQRSLAQTLTLSTSGMKTSEASNQYINNLTSHMISSLVELSGKPDLKIIGQQPNIILLVSCLLERLRGVARASEPRTQKAIYQMGFSVMNPVLMFLQIYKDESIVIYILLKFVADWVEGQIIYLEAQETAAVVDFCMRLLQLYSSHNIGKISVSLSNTLRAEADTEKYKDLRALLQLLSSLCSKDLVDFASEPIEAFGTNISQVVYMGLHIVSPLITLDLLKYPKLCHDYFSLLSHMLEVYPEIIAQLNVEAFSHILATLEFGLHHQDVEVIDLCLRAVKALASYHYKDRGAGKVGLGSHATSYKGPDGKFHEGILSRFLRSLLQLLLFEDYSTDLVGSAADALLPLILCEQSVYQSLVNELIKAQANTIFRSRLENALQSLLTSNNLSSSLDRINYQRFRKNLHSFLIEVRGFLRMV
ncbi:exportin-4 [Striga asiatica]|uniref:Exportin-4 n=1 Tax=Striga asiatica TaxID=4170 RepID=A0A5A7QV65_STRAF|nr:exportin-4 [Striga asiatica]